MNLPGFFLLFIAPLAGAAIAIAFRKQAQQHYHEVLSFSGAFLFTIILLHLFPVVFENNNRAGLYVLLGFFIQIVLEQLTHGIEHGHFHNHEPGKASFTALLAGLSLHSFLDGIPLASQTLDSATQHALLFGISVHKIPEGFALASILILSQQNNRRIAVQVLLFSLIAPLAVWAGSWLQQGYALFMNNLVAIAMGSFLHVSTTILFESEGKAHRFNWKRMAVILSGGALAFVFG